VDAPSLFPLGEGALLAFFGKAIDLEANARVRGVARLLKERSCPGIEDVVPAFASLLVVFDPHTLPEVELRDLIRSLAYSWKSSESPPGQTHTIPVSYGGEDGPDLELLARSHGLTTSQVIRYHSNPEYRVFFLGFMPGFAYMGAVPLEVATPRLPAPRVRVPAGSVGIADAQTGVYPFASPGGWNIIGRTAQVLWDPSKPSPALFSPGDTVRFVRSRSQPATATSDTSFPHPSTPVFQVIEPGAFTTIQDQGRQGFGATGLAPGGAMDREAAARANALVGNDLGAAVLEITFTGPRLLAVRTTCVALEGTDFAFMVDGVRVPSGVSWLVRQGSTLHFVGRTGGGRGIRAWLAVSGGFDVPQVLGSRSTYVPGDFGGYAGRSLRAGDVLGAGRPGAPPVNAAGRTFPTPLSPQVDREVELRFTRYMGTSSADPEAVQAFISCDWIVSEKSDRMGTRLRSAGEGPLMTAGREVLSFGVVRGTIQLPPGGDPVVLNADHQTTGGYPVIGVVARADWPLLAQLGPGSTCRFEEISISEARRVLAGCNLDLELGIRSLESKLDSEV
jgi:KipI family sensor histidine kinase inhibitor